MSDQRSDATPGDFPSLFEKASVETADKTISILSAATGRESVNPVPRKKNASPGLLPLGAVLAAGLIGVTYWHFNQTDFDRTHETSTLSQRTSPTPHMAQVTKSPASPSVPMQPRALEPVDRAVVETVKESAVKPASLTAALQEPRGEKAPPGAKRAPPARAVASTTKATPALQGKRPVQNQSAQPQDNGTSVAFIKKATPAATSDQQSVVVVRSAADTDVKLLEGILRLMKRDDTQDTSAMQTTK